MALRDVVIRDAVGGYVVADPVTQRALAGPFRSLDDAATHARRFVPCGQVWREALDRKGRRLGRFLMELRASTIE
jgi:hypothetical protein